MGSPECMQTSLSHCTGCAYAPRQVEEDLLLGMHDLFHLADADTDLYRIRLLQDMELLLPHLFTHRLGIGQSAECRFQLGLEHVETDLSSPLQFFDLRAANECEQQSEDEYPPGR